MICRADLLFAKDNQWRIFTISNAYQDLGPSSKRLYTVTVLVSEWSFQGVTGQQISVPIMKIRRMYFVKGQ